MHEAKRDVVVVPKLINLIFETMNSQEAVGKSCVTPVKWNRPHRYRHGRGGCQ